MRMVYVAAVLAVCATGVDARQGVTDPRAFRADDHYRLRAASDVRVSPDGTTAAFVSRFVDGERRNRSHIWLVKLSDGSLRRLSDENADDSSPRWSPDTPGDGS